METLYKSIDDIPSYYKFNVDTNFIKLKFLNNHYILCCFYPSPYATFNKIEESATHDRWCNSINIYLFNKVEQKWFIEIATNVSVISSLSDSINCCRTAILNLDYKHVYQMLNLLFTQYNMLKDVFHYTLTIYKNYLCVDLKQYQLI